MELLYKNIHSADQLRVHGAVTNLCETVGRTESEPNAPEISEFFVIFSKKSTQIPPGKAGFYHPVERNKCYLTRPDEDEGWGKITPMCREDTQPREHPNSLCLATINANTKF